MIVFGPDNYSAIQMAFDESHVINVVLIKYLEKITKAKKPTRVVEHDHTYEDADSIAKYGRCKKTVTVHKKIDFEAYADQILAKNSDPAEVPTSITIPMNSSADLLGGFQDGAFVTKQCIVVLPDLVTDFTCRIERMAYNITPTSWTVQLFLRDQNLIQRPRQLELKTEVGNNPDKAVLSAHLEDDIDGTGKTITNALIQTASAGNAAVVRHDEDAGAGVIEFHTGDDDEENPAQIIGGEDSGIAYLELNSPSVSGGNDVAASILLASGPSTAVTGAMVTLAPNVTCTGRLIANQLEMDGPPTTSSAANVFVGSGGLLNKVTSLSKFKIDQEPLSLEAVRGVLSLTPKTWFDRAEVTENDGSTEGLRRIPGLIAEDVEQRAPQLATYDAQGDLQGVAYDRVAALLIPIIADQHKRIVALEERLAAIGSEMGANSQNPTEPQGT